MTDIDRLTSLDAGFLQLETDVQPMHVGSMLIMDGPPPSYQEVFDLLASRIDRMPRYRQRVHRMPFDLARPVWADDPDFSLGYHLRHTALPRPGDEEQLRTLGGRIMSQRLDLARPLWEMWVVEGLPKNRWAVINKVHHSMIDGVSGHDLLEIILDREPNPRAALPTRWQPAHPPTWLDRLGTGAAWVALLPVATVRAVGHSAVRSARRPVDAARTGALRTKGLTLLGRQAANPTHVLNGPLGPHRRWVWARGSLKDAKAVKDAMGGTVNDVVLAAVAGGFQRYLEARGESISDDVVRSLVPVSVRPPEQRGRLGNQVTAMFADLPIGVVDPLERLAIVSAQMDQLKASGQAVGVDAMVSAADFVLPTLMALGARVAARVGQRVVNTVTTNIPGPPYPLYLLGRRMLEMFPYIPIAQGVRISIGIVSYDGKLAIGITGDYDAVPDIDVLCAGIEEALEELADAVR